jgi:threonine dehydratase
MGGAASIAAARQLKFKEDDLAVAVVSGGNV